MIGDVFSYSDTKCNTHRQIHRFQFNSMLLFPNVQKPTVLFNFISMRRNMKRIIKLIMMFGLVGALPLFAQEVKPGKVEVIDLGKGVKLEMVLVPAGKFIMGVSCNATHRL